MLKSVLSIIPQFFDFAYLGMNSHATFHQGRGQNNSFFPYLDWASGTVADQSSINLYVFNPFSSSSYTFFISQSMSTYAPAGLASNGFKGIAVAKNTSSATGIQLQPSQGGTFGLEIRTYGLGVDS